MKHTIAIIGTVGVPAEYGGFESLVDNLLDYPLENAEYTVFCSSKHYNEKRYFYKGARLKYLPFKANGVQSILYDIYSMIIAAKQNHILLVLGVSGGIFLPILRLFYSKVKVITNVDGIEWRRAKWGKLAKWYLKNAEAIAVKYSDVVIADNLGIKEYIQEKYKILPEIIAYGAKEHFPSNIDFLKKLELNPKSYAFKVCRIEPENNVNMILEAFVKISTIKLVIVGNWNTSVYGIELKNKYTNYDHLILLDPIYDLNILNQLRANCMIYVHGHSAGGTNPSLVEAMALKLPIIAFDVNFNRFTLNNQGLFFSNKDELIDLMNNRNSIDFEKLRNTNYNTFTNNYQWSVISEKYSDVFKQQLKY